MLPWTKPGNSGSHDPILYPNAWGHIFPNGNLPLQVMGPQLPMPIDQLVLICPAWVICFTFCKHWVQEYTLNLLGFCQSYILDSMRDGVLVSPAKGRFILLHRSGVFANIILWAWVIRFIIKRHLWNLLNYGNNGNQLQLGQTASHYGWNPLCNFGKNQIGYECTLEPNVYKMWIKTSQSIGMGNWGPITFLRWYEVFQLKEVSNWTD